MDYLIGWHCPAYLFSTLTTRARLHISIRNCSNGVNWKYFWTWVPVPVPSVKCGQESLPGLCLLMSPAEAAWRGRCWLYLMTWYRLSLLVIWSVWTGVWAKVHECAAHFSLSVGWMLLTQYSAGLIAREMNGKCLAQVYIRPVLALQHRDCLEL